MGGWIKMPSLPDPPKETTDEKLARLRREVAEARKREEIEALEDELRYGRGYRRPRMTG
jgi:hypothetical protein